MSLALASCAENECTFHSQCGPSSFCRSGRCGQECTAAYDCDRGEVCSEIGQCVPRDGGPLDAGPPPVDAFVPPVDASVPRDALVPRDAFVPRDAGRDAFVPRDAGRDAFVAPEEDAGIDPEDAGTDAGTVIDAGPPGPLLPSTYTYRRIPIGGLKDAHAVAFHPDGTYALVLERNEGAHVYDWASESAVRVDLRVGGRAIYLDDLAFAHDGSGAWIVGYERVSSADTGVVIWLDDARWRAGDGAAAFSRLTASAAGERFSGVALPRAESGGPAGDGRPVVLSQSGSSPYIARLRELDPATGAFSGLFVARATSAGCDDLAFADNEFGGWGIVLACGTNGADAPYYTRIAGVEEWRAGPFSLGNVSRAAGHPSGAYALIVNWSSRYLHRFEGGAFRPTGTSPAVGASGIYDISLSPDGRVGLIVGRALGSPLRGSVFEYRHDLWSASEITDVSIEGFSLAPYLATSNTYLNDSAFRPGCDGGLIVGGRSDVSTSVGLLIEHQRTDGAPCR